MALAGETILASDIHAVRYVKKAATESVTSSTTLQNDNDFVSIPMAANKIYKVEFYGAAAGNASGDILIDWAVTGGVAELLSRTCLGPTIGMTDTLVASVRISRHALATDVPYGVEATATSAIFETFLIETTTAGTSGTLTMRWAQNASNGTATTLSTSTYWVVTEVEAA